MSLLEIPPELTVQLMGLVNGLLETFPFLKPVVGILFQLLAQLNELLGLA